MDCLVSGDSRWLVKAIYPGEGNGDPDAVPGVQPKPEGETDVPSFTLEVEGEVSPCARTSKAALTTPG